MDSRHLASLISQEICNRVMDCLSTDIPSLRACSTTCRSWAPRAQRYLFHRISITTQRRHEFRKLFESRPQLAQYVRVLSATANDEETDGVDPEWPEVLAMLDKVTDLRLRHIWPFPESQEKAGDNPALSLPNVHTVRLEDYNMRVHMLFRLTFACPALTTLYLDRTVLPYWPVFLRAPEGRAVIDSLSLLDISDYKSAHTLWRLLTSCSDLRIQRLQVGTTRAGEFPLCPELLASVTPAVGELVIASGHADSGKGWHVINTIPLKAFGLLNRVHLKDVSLMSQDVQVSKPEETSLFKRRPSYWWMLVALGQLRGHVGSSGLTDLTISLSHARLRGEEVVFPWKAIDVDLSHLVVRDPRLHFVLNVCTDVSYEQWLTAVAKPLARNLPELAKQLDYLVVTVGSRWDESVKFGGGFRGHRERYYFESPNGVWVDVHHVSRFE